MPQIDLVTGFLGSGKTTFIKKYAKFLTEQGLTVGILENDYGAINIDMVLLQDLMGENCDVEMIVGGDGIVSHRRRFGTKLISMAMTGFDRVIVEPSGIYDTDEFFDVLAEDPLCRWYSPGSILAIVDAELEDELSRESEYLLASQTACAGKIILSSFGPGGSGGFREENVQRILALVNHALERNGCGRRFGRGDILSKDWEEFAGEDFTAAAMAGMLPESLIKLPMEQCGNYGTLFYYGTTLGEDVLRRKLEKTFSDPACGRVLRVKGFVRTDSGRRVQINATRRQISIEPTVFAGEVIIVTGEGLNRSAIDAIWAEESSIITPGDTPMGVRGAL